MAQDSIAHCPQCKSIMVTWNWLNNGDPFENEYYHECWICENVFFTEGPIHNGVAYEALPVLWDMHTKGLPVEYNKHMKALYGYSK